MIGLSGHRAIVGHRGPSGHRAILASILTILLSIVVILTSILESIEQVNTPLVDFTIQANKISM